MKNEKMIKKLVKQNVLFEIQGWENMVDDGELKNEDIENLSSETNLMKKMDNILKESYTNGMLESPMNDIVMEAKHIKFLGNKKLDLIKAEIIKEII